MADHSADLQTILNHIHALLHNPAEPSIPKAWSTNSTLYAIHEYLIGLRGALTQFSSGDFSQDIQMRGFTAGRLKTLQSHLRHMIWHMHQMEKGDFTQRVDFLGDISQSFNHLVTQLNTTIMSMRAKENELTTLSKSLAHDIEQRNFMLRALEQSEAEFKYLAEHDPLTEVLNRRSFFELAQREMMHAYRSKEPCCLALLDVDDFKLFNDTYGHLKGDSALKHVADIGKVGLRQNDIMGRYGGEEFIFLFPKTAQARGISAAERICQAIIEHPLQTEHGEIPLTVSMGVTAIPPIKPTDDFLQLLRRAIHMADLALYAAKRAGKNCVHFIDIEAPYSEKI